MDYPLIIKGEERGRLHITQEGLYTRIEAEAAAEKELTRIWLCGGGEAKYLGIMQRSGEKMYFSARYSRREMAAFPAQIEYAADNPGEREQEQQKESEEQKEENTEKDLLWYRGENGCLTARDGELYLMALPSKIGRSVPGADIRTIEGREYIVFRY